MANNKRYDISVIRELHGSNYHSFLDSNIQEGLCNNNKDEE